MCKTDDSEDLAQHALNFKKKKRSRSKHQRKDKEANGGNTGKFRAKKGVLRSETLLSNNTYNYGTIIDRFLPVMENSPDTKLYHPQDLKSENYEHNGNNNPIIITNNGLEINTWFREPPVDDNSTSQSNHTNNATQFNFASDNSSTDGTSNGVDNPLAHDLNIARNQTNATNANFSTLTGSQPLTYEKNVAIALGFKTSRILTFKPLKSPKKIKNLHDDVDSIQNDIYGNHSLQYDSVEERNMNGTNRNPSNSESFVPEIPFKVLDAPGLRNDYYSNLVCWANKSDTIAAGLGSIVYCWSETLGTIPLQTFGNDLISALSYSSDDFLVVGTKESKIYLYKPKSIHVIASYSLKNHSSICSIKWIPESHYFFVGNDVGEVTLFEVIQKEDVKKTHKNNPTRTQAETKAVVSYSIKQKVTFKCDQQQICGIDVNHLGKQLAIGANNNSSSIWDISDLCKPKKLFHLKHEAAVKAVAFCPWMPNLLATGGGSRDKNIRFWHSKSGTLISKHKTKGQITAVVWSRSKKELLVTFGFGDCSDKNSILAVYSYPAMKLKVKVNAPSDMRILTADLSNDFSSICTSISDQSVRIYNVWNSKFDLKSGIYDNGIYGSEIIDTEEGVDKAIDIIR